MSTAFFRLGENDTRFRAGRSIFIQVLWHYTSVLIFESGLVPFYGPKRALLRLFGARIGSGLLIKPNVRIKCPWKLSIGNHCWIGQEAWIDNMEEVTIGNNVCISQGCFICTGSHDYQTPKMDLVTKPIEIADSVWIAARATVLQGVKIQENTIVTAGSIIHKSIPGNAIFSGNPATKLRDLIVDHDSNTMSAVPVGHLNV